MGNMSYCRFRNTKNALEDCVEVVSGNDDYDKTVKDLSPEELRAYQEMKKLCRDFIDFGEQFER